MTTVDAMAAATPDTRDRYVDFLRVASLLGVIFGHFIMAVVVMDHAAQKFTFTNILELAPWTRGGTLVLQVMPIFFVVGGFAHATTLRSLRRKGGGYADFVEARIGRLVRPALVFIGVWLVVGAILDLAAGDNAFVQSAAQIAGQLLWFIGIYLLAAAFAPLTLRAHERFGAWALAALIAAVIAVDVLRLAGGVTWLMWFNFALVWLAVHQLGYFYADGVADRVGSLRLGAVVAAGGATALALLVWLGPYGIAMVSYNGEKLSNLAPPTVALLAFGVAQAGVLLMLRGRLTRWLQRPRAWKAVIVGGAVAMTAFLWHFTALIAVYAALWALGIDQTAVPTQWQWWAVKALLLVPFLGLVGALVAVFRRFDRPGQREGVAGPSGWRAAVAALSAAFAIVGMLGFAVVGFRGVVSGYVGNIAGVPMTTVVASALVAASAVLAAIAVRRSRTAAIP
jgi:peptidoglycan/LPS O-acetylase OafA/YrhL